MGYLWLSDFILNTYPTIRATIHARYVVIARLMRMSICVHFCLQCCNCERVPTTGCCIETPPRYYSAKAVGIKTHYHVDCRRCGCVWLWLSFWRMCWCAQFQCEHSHSRTVARHNYGSHINQTPSPYSTCSRILCVHYKQISTCSDWVWLFL